MMSYANDFVLSIIHDGSPVHESTGTTSATGRRSTINLPFNAEYKIRLKNKQKNLRAKAKVFIDGRKVSNLGDFILQPGQTLDLERFLDESLSKGSRFKFVPLSDGRVADPTSEDNGIVKVEFYREEAPPVVSWTWGQPLYPPNPNPWHAPKKGGFDITWTNETSSTYIQPMSYCSNTNLVGSVSRGNSLPGATVEGGISNQKFAVGDDFQTDMFPTVLEIKISGLEKLSSPGSVERTKERFCSSCGKRRSKLHDKYCSRCGSRFDK